MAVSIAYIRPDANASWDETYVFAAPVGNGVYVTQFKLNYSGVFALRAKAMASNVAYSAPTYIHVAGGPGPRAVDGNPEDWVGQPPPAPGVAVSMYELIITDPADDQYKFYRPDWNWPPTDDLDAAKLRLYLDGNYLYGLVKLHKLSNIYAPYVMIAIGLPGAGFSEWLPDWSDTKLSFAWSYVIGINYGKEQPLFIFDNS